MKRKFKRIALASLLLSSSGLLSLSVLQSSPNKNVSLLTNALNLPPEDDYKDLVSDWYTIKSYAYGPDEDNDYEGRADLELLLSPVFSDYKNVNAASLKNFINIPQLNTGLTALKFMKKVV